MRILLIALALLSTQMVAAEAQYDKILLLQLNFTEGKMFFEDAEFSYTTAPKPVFSGKFYVKTFSNSGETTYESFFDDPREIFSETFYENGSIEGFHDFEENTQFVLPVAIDSESSAVKISDENKTTLLTIYLSELEVPKIFFCQRPNDVCDLEFCGETDVDCTNEEKLSETAIEENSVAKTSENEKQENTPQEKNSLKEKSEKTGYEQAQSILQIILALLIVYIAGNIVYKRIKQSY